MRCPILPEPRLRECHGVLTERLEQIMEACDATLFDSLLDPMMRDLIGRGFAEAGADEGTVWLVDGAGEHLVPVHNTGPHADRFVGRFRQPLGEGLICMVFSSEQAFLENEVFRNEQQSRKLDRLLDVQTHALLAVPFTLFDRCRGVVSCVQLRRTTDTAPVPDGFSPEALNAVQRTAVLLTALLEYRVLNSLLGRPRA